MNEILNDKVIGSLLTIGGLSVLDIFKGITKGRTSTILSWGIMLLGFLSDSANGLKGIFEDIQKR